MSDIRFCIHCGARSDEVPFKSKNVCRACGNEASKASHRIWYENCKGEREAAYRADPIVKPAVAPGVDCDCCGYFLQCRAAVLRGEQILCKPVRASDLQLAKAWQESRYGAKYG